MRLLKICFGAAVLTAFLAPGASADGYDKLTHLTFSGPVQLPGVEMPAGTYTFKLADPSTSQSRTVISVNDKATLKQIGMFITIPDRRMEPTDEPVVMFRETAAGQPQAVKSWFYPGETTGFEFIYPREQALRIARGTGQPVVSMASTSSTSTSELSSAEVSRIEDEASYLETTESVAQVTPEPIEPQPVGTSGQLSDERTTEARSLPDTASPLPLVELLSGLAFAGALGARRLRKRFGPNV